MPRRKDNEIYKYKLKSGKVKYGFKTYIGTDPETGKAVKPSSALETIKTQLIRRIE